jgi:hypothetical protein
VEEIAEQERIRKSSIGIALVEFDPPKLEEDNSSISNGGLSNIDKNELI